MVEPDSTITIKDSSITSNDSAVTSIDSSVTSPQVTASIHRLHSLDRATLNLRNTGDLITHDLRFYHPDLVTSGRPIHISAYGAGSRWTCVFWRGRPWRDLLSNSLALESLPPQMIGSVETSIGVNPYTTGGWGTISLAPIQARPEKPLTSLHHRDGYYGFAPVEFTHIRPLSPDSRFYLGGYFPASTGKFPPHSAHRGQTLWGEIEKEWTPEQSLSIGFMDGLNKVESSYQDYRSVNHRNDLDIDYCSVLVGLPTNLNLYRSETHYGLNKLPAYGREFGLSLGFGAEPLGLDLNFARSSGVLPGDEKFENDAPSASVHFALDLLDLSLSGRLGVDGELPDRLNLHFSVAISAPELPLEPFFSLTQVSSNHSPEQRFAHYDTLRYENPLEPVWVLNPTLPIEGRRLSPSILRGGEAGVKIPFIIGDFDASLFAWQESDAAAWKVQDDTVIVWANIGDRQATGWSSSWHFQQGVWRSSLGAVGMKRDLPNGDPTQAEPPFRLAWEVGRHQSFFNGALETDFLLSGKYFARFHSPSELPDEPLGGAYPMDFRFTGRIRHFTFHYGVHNFNAYPYTLVPGYRMMHKEEYWGIDWLLIN